MGGVGALMITLSGLSPTIGVFVVGADVIHQAGTGTFLCFLAAALLGRGDGAGLRRTGVGLSGDGGGVHHHHPHPGPGAGLRGAGPEPGQLHRGPGAIRAGGGGLPGRRPARTVGARSGPGAGRLRDRAGGAQRAVQRDPDRDLPGAGGRQPGRAVMAGLLAPASRDRAGAVPSGGHGGGRAAGDRQPGGDGRGGLGGGLRLRRLRRRLLPGRRGPRGAAQGRQGGVLVARPRHPVPADAGAGGDDRGAGRGRARLRKLAPCRSSSGTPEGR